MQSDLRAQALQLYSLSPLKQRKVAMLQSYLETTSGGRCLDLGSDNGVVSLLLREGGGEWSSADLSAATVEAIRSLVGERVFQTDGKILPFPDAHFDLIAVVDLLEHVADDKQLANELFRVLKPGGALIVNVPNPIPGLIRWLRLACGQTDERHGHLRAGYNLSELDMLLGERFLREQARAYGRGCSELVDFLITGALDVLKRGSRGVKGQVVAVSELSGKAGALKMYRLIYPLLKVMVRFDEYLPGNRGNMLIAKYRRT